MKLHSLTGLVNETQDVQKCAVHHQCLQQHRLATFLPADRLASYSGLVRMALHSPQGGYFLEQLCGCEHLGTVHKLLTEKR